MSELAEVVMQWTIIISMTSLMVIAQTCLVVIIWGLWKALKDAFNE